MRGARKATAAEAAGYTGIQGRRVLASVCAVAGGSERVQIGEAVLTRMECLGVPPI